jgi:type IV secretion system protein VirB9
MTADKLHFDWNTKGYGKLLPARVFDDGTSLYLAWNRETPLPAILTVSEDRKEGPISYRMKGDYIVVSPIPANLVLRYGSKSASLWPSRRITPVRPSQSPVQQASIHQPTVQAPAPQPAPPPAAPAPEPTTNGAVRLANMTALYSDKLTDADHEK